MDDFLNWMISPEGQTSEKALFAVMDSLESSIVVPEERVIVWNDGQRLSIEQTASRIHQQSNLPLSKIESHVIGWLEMHYVPEGLDDKQMEHFEAMIDSWIKDYENSQRSGLNAS